MNLQILVIGCEGVFTYLVHFVLIDSFRSISSSTNGIQGSNRGPLWEDTLVTQRWTLFGIPATIPGKQKFGLTFFSDLCHRTPSLVSAADSRLVAFFSSLKNENLLNDTVFITMSDHGGRCGDLGQSPRGKIRAPTSLVVRHLPLVVQKYTFCCSLAQNVHSFVPSDASITCIVLS